VGAAQRIVSAGMSVPAAENEEMNLRYAEHYFGCKLAYLLEKK
jgi:hypothetical protein